MDAVSMNASGYASQLVNKSLQSQSQVLVELSKVISRAVVAQSQPLANLGEVHKVDLTA